MSNYPGETFVSNGHKYVLKIGPKGDLRPYYLGPIIPKLLLGGWLGWAIAGVLLAGVLVASAFCDDEDAELSGAAE